MQTHTLILWAHTSIRDFNDIVFKTYSVLEALREFGPELSPNYLTTNRKADVNKANLTYEGVKQLVQKNINKEGKNLFPDLGHRLSFFSALDEYSSSRVNLTVGTSNPRFKDSLIVTLPQSLSIYQDETVTWKIINLFKKCCQIFEPYWGCIQNDSNANRFDSLWNDSLPTAVHWVNYFGDDVVKVLGEEKIGTAPMLLTEKLDRGYILVLKQFPINDSESEDITRQAMAAEYFGI